VYHHEAAEKLILTDCVKYYGYNIISLYIKMTNVLSQDIDSLFVTNELIDISNALVITGGGAVQAYFAMGGCGCLHQNDMLNVDSYDVITSVSGGAIIALFLELCFLYKYDLEDDWFNKYVRKGGIYAAVNAKVLSNLVANMGDMSKLSIYLGEQMPAWWRSIEEGEFGRGPVFEYNYIDVQKSIISTDHRDVVDFETGDRTPNWLFTRLARCTLPILITNNKLTADAGLGSNIPVSTMWDKYNIENNVDIININPRYIRKTYPNPTIGDIFTQDTLFSIAMYTPANSIQRLIDVIYKGETNTIISSSSEFDPSPDIYHKNLFTERLSDMPYLHSFLQGILFTDLTQIKILENEGYIQMYHELKSKGRLKEGFVFTVPNPDVYGPETVAKFKKTLDTSIIPTVIGDIFNACIN